MKLLLVTWYFPPSRTIAAVRLGKLARYLLAQGHDLRVLTPQDPPLPQDLAVDFPAERVIRTPWQAAKAGSAPAGHGQAPAAAGTMPAADGGRPPLLKREIRRLRASFSRFPDARAPWLPFALEAGGEGLPGLDVALTPVIGNGSTKFDLGVIGIRIPLNSWGCPRVAIATGS